MADKKISELLTATALTGDEIIPIDQGGVTKKTTMSEVFLGKSTSELGYAERSTDFIAGATLNVYEDIPSVSITITGNGIKPIMLEAWIYTITHSVANGRIGVAIREGSTVITNGFHRKAGVSHASTPMFIRRRIIPSAGPHTYVLSVYGYDAGTATLLTANNSPLYLRAVGIDVL